MRTVEDINKILFNDFGLHLSPKNTDGRVEIPKKVVVANGWKDSVYVFNKGNHILISKYKIDEDYIDIINNSCGRFRLPYGLLKSVGFSDMRLFLLSDFNGTVFIRRDFSISKIRGIFSTINENKISQISDIINPTEVRKLFLLDCDNPTMFRPTGLPYKITCKWIEDEPMICTSGYRYFLIPGIKTSISGYSCGYLFIDTDTFYKIIYLISKIKNRNTPEGLDLIFTPKSGKFWVNKNIGVDIPDDVIDSVKYLENPENIIRKYFREFPYNKGESLPPLSVNCGTAKL
jgi:hypothetical protein